MQLTEPLEKKGKGDTIVTLAKFVMCNRVTPNLLKDLSQILLTSDSVFLFVAPFIGGTITLLIL